MATSRQVKDIATALVLEAIDAKDVQAVCADVRLIAETFASDPRIVADLEEGAVPLNIRQDALRAACGKTIHPLVTNAFLVLQRESLLSAHAAFSSAVLAQAGSQAQHRTAVAVSAVSLTADEKAKLASVLEKKFPGTLDLSFDTDASILGGLVVRVGDWQCDASAKGNIDRLHAKLLS